MLIRSQHPVAGPESDDLWQPPRELPDLRRVDLISLDTETNDEGLRADLGSSWPWGDGYICGISVAWRKDGEIRAIYIPMRHPETDNFDPAQVYRWLKDLIASGVRIVMMNGVYDFGWLRTEAGIGMPRSDRLEEVGALAALVDENQREYSLDAICQRCGLPGKDTALLENAVKGAGFVKGRKKIKVQSHIWQLPARYVGPYAEADAIATLEAYDVLTPIIDREGTRDAYRLEVDLLPMVLEMRRRGIRINQDATEQARDLILSRRDAALAELSGQHGAVVGMDEINGRKWKVATFDHYGIVSPNKTAKGAPSFKAGKMGWMTKHPHWLPRLIATASKYDAAGNKFLEGHILNHIVNGRIYAEIHPFRADDGGAKSLRFSYSDPPLQQMPSRDEELAPIIRGVFLPEDDEVWAKPDVSQQEFRFVVHRAVQHGLPGAHEAAEAYRNDPDADFHQIAAEITELFRSDAKAVNFAKDIWRRREEVRRDDWQVAGRGGGALCAIRPPAAIRGRSCRDRAATGRAHRPHQAL
jgi:Mesyanzhinovviridae DNA polymerase